MTGLEQRQRNSLVKWLAWPERFEFGTVELVVMRLLFGWVLFSFILTAPPRFPGLPYPNGLAHLMDLGFLRDAHTVSMLSITAQVCLVLGVLGVCEPLTLGWLLFVIVASKSYNQSQGNLGHAGQLVTLCLLAQWLASLRALAADTTGLRGLLWAGPVSWRRQAWWMIQTLAAGYTASALTKMIVTHGDWPMRGSNFLLQIYKAQTEMEVSRMLVPSPFATVITDFIASHRWFGTFMLIPTWLLEFGAFAALFNRRLSLIMGLALIGFHRMTQMLMGISFAEHQYILWIFFVNPAYWLCVSIAWAKTRLRGNGPGIPSAT
ncbi:MAG: hypothetical protein JWO08_154 [Verrucomicrobiaceae bacterium]|nr:hypothetical protein [Verrucomicrobiaceae bacterium]